VNGVHVRLRLGRERYAVPIENVLEVAELGTLSALPGTGPAMLGVRNLRGRVLPVFDLARVLAIAGDAGRPRVVVAEHEGWIAGLAVDEVTDVVALASAAEPAEAESLSGAILEDDQLIGILDIERLFSSLAAQAA
jgi:purine-binding chemotaxis protein CheW